jgi:hypothetical protein
MNEDPKQCPRYKIPAEMPRNKTGYTGTNHVSFLRNRYPVPCPSIFRLFLGQENSLAFPKLGFFLIPASELVTGFCVF